MTREEFYKRCGELIGCEYEFIVQGKRVGSPTPASRWGGRIPGNGRYPGHGIIRVFTPKCIHVNLKSPKISGEFKSYEEVLERLDGQVRRNK